MILEEINTMRLAWRFLPIDCTPVTSSLEVDMSLPTYYERGLSGSLIYRIATVLSYNSSSKVNSN